MLKLIAPLDQRQPVRLNDQDSDSEPENIPVASTSTPVKTTITKNSKTLPNNSRNRNDSRNQNFYIANNATKTIDKKTTTKTWTEPMDEKTVHNTKIDTYHSTNNSRNFPNLRFFPPPAFVIFSLILLLHHEG